MLQQISNLNTVQNSPNPQMNTAFKANPVATTNALERTPVSDTLDKPTKDKTSKKSGLSIGAKWALGIATTAATIYGGIVLHKHLTKPSIEKVAKNFSEIFKKDVSKEEAIKMAERYKEIFAEKEKDKFIEKCFEQVKKDFGYEDLTNLKCSKISEVMINEAKERGSTLGGGYRPVGAYFEKVGKNTFLEKFNGEIMEINPHLSQKEIFKSIVHEFTHAKQHEMCYRTDSKALIDALVEGRLSGLKNQKDYTQIVDEYIAAFKENYQKVWDRLPKIDKSSKEYEKVKKYLEEIRQYETSGATKEQRQKYMSQLIEQEAHATKPLVYDICKFFENPWRIF